MNCDRCLYLNKENRCIIGKHSYLNPIFSEDGKVLNLSHECIFKNEVYDNINYEIAKAFAKTRVAIGAYYVINSNDDIAKLKQLLEDEKWYGDTIIGQFNVICKNVDISEIKEISDLFAQSKRLWRIEVLFEDQWENNPIVDIPQFIIDTCTLPYFIIIKDKADFGAIKTFEEHCMSNRVPAIYAQSIYRISTLRQLIESYEQEEEDAEFQI